MFLFDDFRCRLCMISQMNLLQPHEAELVLPWLRDHHPLPVPEFLVSCCRQKNFRVGPNHTYLPNKMFVEALPPIACQTPLSSTLVQISIMKWSCPKRKTIVV